MNDHERDTVLRRIVVEDEELLRRLEPTGPVDDLIGKNEQGTARRVTLIGHPDAGKTTLARSTPGEYRTGHERIDDDGAGGVLR